MGTVSFWTTGEDFTNLIRDMWVSCLPYNAFEALDGLNQANKIAICTGQLKFEGDTRKDGTLDVVKDNSIEYNNCKLWTPEEVVEILEMDFLKLELSLRSRRENLEYEFSTQLSYSSVDISDADGSTQNLRQMVKRVLKQLEYIYPVVGKTMADLPIDKLFKHWNQYELNHMENMIYTREKIRTTSRGQLLAAGFPNEIVNKVDNAWPDGKGINKLIQTQELMASPLMRNIDPESLDVDTYVKRMVADDRENIESQDIKTTIFNSGYIDRQGNFYGCSDTTHSSFAEDLYDAGLIDFDIDENTDSEDFQIYLEENGWIKLSMGRLIYLSNDKFPEPTLKQKRAMIKYSMKRKNEQKEVIYYNDKKYLIDEFSEEIM